MLNEEVKLKKKFEYLLGEGNVIKKQDRRLRRAGGSLLESKDFEKDLEFYLDKDLKMKSHCNSVAKRPKQS